VYCERFWVPRGADPDLSDDGFLLDPKEPHRRPSPALPFEAFAATPVLGLLGEPGMGKTTALAAEHERLKSGLSNSREQVISFDLAAYGSDSLLDQEVFKSRLIKWPNGVDRIHVFFDGLDECLAHIPNLVRLLLQRLQELPRDRVSLRLACRTADWPMDLENGLAELWGEHAVAVYELAPLRSDDVRMLAEARGYSAAEFLDQVDRIGVSSLASRPITLEFLLNQFAKGEELPANRAALYEEGCRVLCDEWQESRSREQKLSSGLRLAIASRVAATLTYCSRTAVWRGPRHKAAPSDDARLDELLGAREVFDKEVLEQVGLSDLKETLSTALFRSRGRQRVGFSHQTYAEYLAARYIVDRRLPTDQVLKLVLHPDGAGKVVPKTLRLYCSATQPLRPSRKGRNSCARSCVRSNWAN
jgi:predicted NACHT family NTPase